MVVLIPMREAITPPAVSIPRDSGATSSSNKPPTAPPASPVRMAACTAAPQAMVSSGLMDPFNSLPLKKSWSSFQIPNPLLDLGNQPLQLIDFTDSGAE